MTIAAHRSRFRLLPAERAALAVGLWQLLDHGLGVELYRRLWVLALIPTLILVVVTAALIARFGSRALRSSGMTAGERYRTGLAVPLTSLAVQLISLPHVGIPQTIAARMYFALHQAEWADASARAGAGKAYAISYVQGVPDGGMAFVHVEEGRPESLPVEQQLRQTGERISGCRNLADAWLCGYD